jgi:polar amino acid transport system ATP-binding protein
MPDEVLVKIQGVHKYFGDTEVLKDVNLGVHRGEVVVLIGSSGSGKTTLLRCVNFLEDYQKGVISIGGETVGYKIYESGARRKRPEKENERLRTRVGIVFQSYNLFPHLTVLENLLLAPLKVLRMNKKQVEQKARGLLGKVGLAEKAQQRPAALSGGQQQRVAIARALMMEPELMLFDEVTSALDPELVGEVLIVMQELAAEGMTMIVVTHEMSFAYEVAHRVAFLTQGAIAEIGPPDEIFGAPKNEQLRQFLQHIRGLPVRSNEIKQLT